MFVFVVDKNRNALNPCHPARARKFLKSGRAVVLVRTTGSFNILTANGLVQGINYKYCSHVHGKDGYQYSF
ncbi:RRXRR domain-containing protein [Coleofasciculus chthonoplastes]|uniref:RRXRR domain-containing protein n=1 Tax=Coleofasciculus chthonoplastes TaxID=64178 RepID=UPI003300E3F8